jgi:hypothetical protein
MLNACMLTHSRVQAGVLCMLLHSLVTSVLAYDVPHAVAYCACCLSAGTRRVSCCSVLCVLSQCWHTACLVLCCDALAAGTLAVWFAEP